MNRSFKQIYEQEIVKNMRAVFSKIYADKTDMTVNGIKAFGPDSEFIGGTVANACVRIFLEEKSGDERACITLGQLKSIIEFTSCLEMKTWGILLYISALQQLDKNGLLEKVVDENRLESLKASLDWRHFVNLEDLSLINLPTNYYGVATEIAGLRELLGWDREAWSEKLKQKLMGHIETYSGQDGFMDETDGEGRFDSYSINAPVHICGLYLKAGLTVPEKYKQMLRTSCGILLSLANTKGNGFP